MEAPRVYDPKKAHEYYERTKHLKPRQPKVAVKKAIPKSRPKAAPKPAHANTQNAKARVGRLRVKIAKLKSALAGVEAELSKKHQTSRKKKAAQSDGKTTSKERQSSKQYRDAHKQELASKRKKSSGGSSSSSSSSVSDMSVEELETRATKIRGLIREAQRQLSNANQEHGQLAHSALVSDPHVSERFAQFNSAERIPSK